MSDNVVYPTAAQVARNKAEVEAAIKQALTAMNLKIRSIELAAQFPTDKPVELAQRIYEFIRADEDYS